jgi:hypothetical protein
MNRTLRHETVALVLAGGALLGAAPANANAVDNEGYFGGSWSSIGPSNYYQRRHAGRVGAPSIATGSTASMAPLLTPTTAAQPTTRPTTTHTATAHR